MKEPKIRFKGFSGEWKRSTLGDLALFSKGSGYSKSDICKEGTPVILYGRMYTKYQSVFDEIDTFVNPKDNSVVSKGGEVIIPGSGESSEDISLAAMVKNEGVIIGGDLNILKFNQKVNDPAFMSMAITYSPTRAELSSYSQGKTVVHLRNSEIAKGTIRYPNISEQNTIVNYVLSLDAQISASTSRLASLKQMKAASLQAMFPQEGETVPKVRFKGFKGKWKKVKLGEIGSWSKGKLLSKDNISETGKFKCIHYGELFTMYDEIIYQVFSKTDLNNGCLSQIGDILFPDSDVTPTGLARCSSIMETGVMLGGGILILRPLPQYYSPFISLSVNNEKQQIISRITGTTVRHINATSLSEIEIVCTENIAEQQSIASFFTSLDRQITLHTQRLEKLKQIKVACLDKMFV